MCGTVRTSFSEMALGIVALFLNRSNSSSSFFLLFLSNQSKTARQSKGRFFLKVAFGKVHQRSTAAAGNISECGESSGRLTQHGRRSDSRVQWLFLAHHPHVMLCIVVNMWLSCSVASETPYWNSLSIITNDLNIISKICLLTIGSTGLLASKSHYCEYLNIFVLFVLLPAACLCEKHIVRIMCDR